MATKRPNSRRGEGNHQCGCCSAWAGGLIKASLGAGAGAGAGVGGVLNNEVQDNLKFKAIGWVQTM